jgi:hypothetical protein
MKAKDRGLDELAHSIRKGFRKLGVSHVSAAERDAYVFCGAHLELTKQILTDWPGDPREISMIEVARIIKEKLQ